MPKEPFEKISIVGIATGLRISLEEARDTVRELRDKGLMDISLDENTCWFLPEGIQVVRELTVSETLKEINEPRNRD